MKIINLLFLIINFILCNTSVNIVELETLNEFGKFEVYLGYGREIQKSSTLIDIKSEFSFTNPLTYSPDSSLTTLSIGNTTLNINKKTDILVQKLIDTVHLPNAKLKLDKFPFFHIIFKKDSQISALGLSYQFDNESYSLVHQLFWKGLIDKKAFALITTSKKRGKIFFGGVPFLVKSRYFTSFCQVNKNYKTWNCELQKISIGNLTFPHNGPVFFQSTENDISCPEKVYKTINETIFPDYYKRGVCKFSIRDDSSTLPIRCECDEIKNFPNMQIMIENQVFELSHQELFEKLFNLCVFNLRIEQNGKWILSPSFFQKYNPLFDYENDTITFFSEESTHHLQVNDNNKYSKYLLLGILYSMVIMTILLCLKVFKKI